MQWVVVVWVGAMVAVGIGGRRLRRWLWPLLVRLWPLVARVRGTRPDPPAPLGRPIEAIARDAHRLGLFFHHPPPGVSFARFEGCRRAYDDVLAEACRALDVPHLLHVLPPSPEHDRERQRVELLLGWAGLPIDDVA
jgi:hypothetical protein